MTAFKNFSFFITIFFVIPFVNFGQSLNELLYKIEYTNWLDTVNNYSRIFTINYILKENGKFDNYEWQNIDTVDKIKITEDAIYREGIYETEFSRSNLQKKLWLIECIIAKEITKEKYLLDLKQNKIILDFSLKTLELKRSNKEKRKIKKIYFLYQNHFLNFHPEKQEIKSPLPNQRYRWVNPYSS